MNIVLKALAAIVGIVVLVLLFSFLFSLPVFWLWNWLCPALFGLPTITVWQAWGLLMLCGFLFRSSSNSTTKSSGP